MDGREWKDWARRVLEGSRRKVVSIRDEEELIVSQKLTGPSRILGYRFTRKDLLDTVDDSPLLSGVFLNLQGEVKNLRKGRFNLFRDPEDGQALIMATDAEFFAANEGIDEELAIHRFMQKFMDDFSEHDRARSSGRGSG